MGAVSGARTVAAPLLVADHLRRSGASRDTSLVRWLAAPGMVAILAVSAVVETIADKLPFTGDRTTIPGLLVRGIAGGVAVAALSSAEHRGWSTGATLGVLGAVVGAFATFRFRRVLHQDAGLPGGLAGLVEDVLVYGLGRELVRRGPRARPLVARL